MRRRHARAVSAPPAAEPREGRERTGGGLRGPQDGARERRAAPTPPCAPPRCRKSGSGGDKGPPRGGDPEPYFDLSGVPEPRLTDPDIGLVTRLLAR